MGASAQVQVRRARADYPREPGSAPENALKQTRRRGGPAPSGTVCRGRGWAADPGPGAFLREAPGAVAPVGIEVAPSLRHNYRHTDISNIYISDARAKKNLEFSPR